MLAHFVFQFEADFPTNDLVQLNFIIKSSQDCVHDFGVLLDEDLELLEFATSDHVTSPQSLSLDRPGNFAMMILAVIQLVAGSI